MDRNVINLYLKFLSVNPIYTTGNAKTRSIARRGSGASIVNISLSISRRKKQFYVHVQPTELHNITWKRLSTSARRLLWKKKLQVNFVYYNLWAFLSFFSPITGPRRQKKKRYSWIASKFIDFIGLYTSQPAEFLIHVYSRPHEKKWQFSNEFDWSRR